MRQAVSVAEVSDRMSVLQAPTVNDRAHISRFIREVIARKMHVPLERVTPALRLSVAVADELGVVLASYGIKIELPRRFDLINLTEIMDSASLC